MCGVIDSDGFTRKGNDLWTDKTINAFEAIRGTEFNIRLLDDSVQRVKVPAGTQPNAVLNLKGLGMPIHETLNIKGNVYIRINVTIPKLSKEELKKIQDL